MGQKDFLLRQIEALGALLQAVRKLITGRKGDGEEVHDRLKEISDRAGMDLELARASSPDTLRFLIAPTGEVEPGKCWVLAETLYLDGLQAGFEELPERAWDSLQKARMLYALVAPMGAFLVGFPEAEERMEEIDGMLAEMEGGEMP